MGDRIPVIIVSHNSRDVLPLCLASLGEQQGCSPLVTVVDSGSDKTDYLKELQRKYDFTLIEKENLGFSRANNIGWESLEVESDIVVFCNPDAILPADYLQSASALLHAYPEAGMVSGPLHGFDPDSCRPTGLYDSTGVLRRWYGRWYDRDQGYPVEGVERTAQKVPGLCGALLVCRKEAVETLGAFVFDPDFFLYKEDIELSLRMRKKGWSLMFFPELVAYHCRGWNRDRREVSRELREHAAKSEVLLYRKHPSPYMIWALAKLAAVRWFGI